MNVWLPKEVDDLNKELTGDLVINAPAPRKKRQARKFKNVRQAIIKLFGAVSRIPDDLTKDEFHEAVVAELRREKPKAEVSWSTIVRVLKSE